MIMWMDDTGITLEMTGPEQLRPSPQMLPMVVHEVSVADAALVGQLYNEIWAPLGGGGRAAWHSETWRAELEQPGIRTWVAHLDERPIGFAEMGWPGDGQVGIVVIGVVPSAQGRGLGGDLLTRMTRVAWRTPAPNGASTKRVWLWTRPEEHPHTMSNYLARGYRITGNE